MKRLFNGFLMSLSMFSRIPINLKSWNDDDMNLVIPMLPFVGLIMGILWWVSVYLIKLLGIPLIMKSIVLTFIIYFVTGFIHVDGFIDTIDAISSRKGIEEKREILKDSRVGAFGSIYLTFLLLFTFSAFYTIIESNKSVYSFLIIPILSRSLTGLSLLVASNKLGHGYGSSFSKDTKPIHKYFLICLILICLPLFWLTGYRIEMYFVLVICFLLQLRYLTKEFGGISGDLCGFMITLTELLGIIMLSF